MNRAVQIATAGVIMVSPWQAQADEMSDHLSQCAAIKGNSQRLGCYDALAEIARMSPASSNAQVPTQPATKTVPYGSRVGMEVTVVSTNGIDSNHAVIVAKHTRENALTYCREYVDNVTEKCIRDELEMKLSKTITNCTTGEFTNFYGDRLRFAGPGTTGEFHLAKFIVVDTVTGEIEDGSTASGYSVNLELFKALYPKHAPEASEQ
jgi:hypothetical protein